MEDDELEQEEPKADGTCPKCGSELVRELVHARLCEVSHDDKCPKCGYVNKVRVLGGPDWPDNGPREW